MIIFWVKESFKLIGRAKSSFFLSLISTSISVLLIAACIIIIQASSTFQNNLRESVTINIFLNDSISKTFTLEKEKNEGGGIPGFTSVFFLFSILAAFSLVMVLKKKKQ